MIHEITIENFFSIAEAQTLNFRVPRNAPDAPNFIPSRSDPEVRLPTAIGFFGANASGKSTILRALYAVVAFVHSSFSLAPDGAIPLFNPHMKKECFAKPTKISLTFDGPLPTNGVCRYEIHIAYAPDKFFVGGFGGSRVTYEALFHAPEGRQRMIFERKGQDFHFGSDFQLSKHDKRIAAIRPNASIVSMLAQLNHDLSIQWTTNLKAMQTNIAGYGKTQENTQQWLPFYASNPLYLDKLNQDLRRLDLGLEKMEIEQSPSGFFAEFTHAELDYPILLDLESQGTRSFIEKFPRLQYALDTGGVVTIDELDNDIHPQILSEILGWFNDPERNPHKAQLIFVAHNPAILDVVEKEQIFFTVKKASGATEIYGAKDIKGLRREPSLMKKYLAGELGAVPVIG